MTDNPVTTPPAPPKRVKRKRPLSRPQRWMRSTAAASDAVLHLRNAADEVIAALEDLRAMQEEYVEWKENLPENLQQSPTGEKLEEIENLDIESVIDSMGSIADDAENLIGDAEGIDPPRGFGRD